MQKKVLSRKTREREKKQEGMKTWKVQILHILRCSSRQKKQSAIYDRRAIHHLVSSSPSLLTNPDKNQVLKQKIYKLGMAMKAAV